MWSGKGRAAGKGTEAEARWMAGADGECLCSRQGLGSACPKVLKWERPRCVSIRCVFPRSALSSKLFLSSFKKHALHISNLTHVLWAGE